MKKCKKCGVEKLTKKFRFYKKCNSYGAICINCINIRTKTIRTDRLVNGKCLHCTNLRDNKTKNCNSCIKTARKCTIKRKLKIFDYYGGKICKCCGETTVEFLTLDHINGGGHQQRKSIGFRTYEWIIKNNFPEGFQILCMNCNWSKGIHGYCPHEKEIINGRTNMSAV